MQFHVEGFRAGDPRVRPAHPAAAARPAALPDEVDVLIVGCGPAGHAARGAARRVPRHPHPHRRAAGRSARARPGRRHRLPHRRDVRGVRARRAARSPRRTGSTRRRSGARSAEDRSRIVRTGRIQDTEDGLSEFPHLIVNQARMQRLLPRVHAPVAAPARARLRLRVRRPGGRAGEGEYPVVVTLRTTCPTSGAESDVRAKYVVGCDGARSQVRDVDRREPRRRLRQPRLGRHGRARRHRLPRHPAQVRDPVRRRAATSCSSRARAATWCACTSTSARSTRTTATPSASITAEQIIAEGATRPAPVHARRAKTSRGSRVRGRPAPHRPVRRRARRRRPAPACRASSSPATRATRTAPRPARA